MLWSATMPVGLPNYPKNEVKPWKKAKRNQMKRSKALDNKRQRRWIEGEKNLKGVKSRRMTGVKMYFLLEWKQFLAGIYVAHFDWLFDVINSAARGACFSLSCVPVSDMFAVRFSHCCWGNKRERSTRECSKKHFSNISCFFLSSLTMVKTFLLSSP